MKKLGGRLGFASSILTAAALALGGCHKGGADGLQGTLVLPGFSFSLAGFTVNEAAGTATITVRRNGAASGAASVGFFTSNGTAVAGSDYTAASGTLSWADGDSADKTLTIPITADAAVEGDETLTVTLSSPSGTLVITGPASVLLTILDANAPAAGVLQFDAASYTVNENDGTATITVTRTGGSAGPASVTYGTTPGSALAPGDYATTSNTLSWADADAAPKSFTVAIANDSTAEPTESLTLTLSGASGASLGTTTSAPLSIVDDDVTAGLLEFIAAAFSRGEAGPTATLTVRRVGGSAGAVGVTYATSDGSAAAPGDYAAVTSTLSWADGDAADKSFTVTLVDDQEAEDAETVNLALSAPTGGAQLGAQSTAVLTIADNDTAGFTVTPTSGLTTTESGGTATFTVALTSRPTANVVVTLTSSDTSEGTVAPSPLTFNAANALTPVTVTVTGVDDAPVDGAVAYTIQITSSSADPKYSGLDPADVAVTNADNDPRISIADVAAAEGNAGSTAFAFTVSLSVASPTATSVDFATADGTALSGSDYVGGSGTLTIPAGSTSGTITVNVLGDTADELDETFTLNLTNAVNGTIADPLGVGTILNDDDPTITIGDVVVTEGNSGSVNAVFTVTLSNASVQDVTVDFATADGTAAAGSDYVGASGTLTVSAGATTGQITVQVNGDTADELDETFVVNLTNPANATIADAQGLGTIVNDDDPSITINDVAVVEGDSGTVNAVFTVTLSNVSLQDVTVDAATANGTAAAGTDYASAAATLTIAAGLTTQTFTVQVNGDAEDEIDETFVVNLTNPANATISDPQGLGTITNDDDPSITIDDVTVTEGNSGTVNAAFTVTLSNTSLQDVTVQFATADNTAVAPGDYAAVSLSTLTIPANQLTGTITVVVNGDTEGELNETFVVNLSNAGNATIADAQGAGTITNDDLPAVTINDVTVTEGPAASTVNANFTVTLTGANLLGVDVTWATADGSATTANSDYQGASGTLNIPAGNNSGTITVVVNGDGTDELTETFLVNLTGSTNSSIADNQGVGTITNDDDPSISIGNVTLAEGNSGATAFTFTITLSNASLQIVDYTFSTADGTATAPADYASVSGAFQIPAGTTSVTRTVNVVGETTDEVDETFTVALSGVTNTTNATASATGTITNDDTPPTISINDVSVTEGNTGAVNAVFTVSLSQASGKAITVDFATADGTAQAGFDYTAASGTLTIPVGQTSGPITVSVTGDTIDEVNETYTVNLVNPTNATIADAQGVGTITDDDGPDITISDVTLAEGSGGGTTPFAFTVTLSAASVQDVSVNFATSDGSATTADSDYNANSGTLLIAAGSPSGTITVTVNRDGADELAETFRVTLSGAVNGTITDNEGIGTITNDDDPTISIGDVTVTEGNSGTVNAVFTVSLSNASLQDITVQFATADGTATAGTDYTGIALTTLLIPASQTSGTVTVLVSGDTNDEANETFVVNLSNPSADATILDGSGLGTILNDDDPTITIIDVSQAEGAFGTTNFIFNVNLDRPSFETVTFDFATADGTTNPATGGVDYVIIPTTPGSIAGGGPQQFQITVQVNGDGVDEVNETFFVNLTNVTNAIVGDAQGLGTILNDDNPTISVNDVTQPEGSGGGTTAFVFTVSLSGVSVETVTVQYQTSGVTATPSPGPGFDYTSHPLTTLTFNPGVTTQLVTVQVEADGTGEPDEAFNVVLSTPTNSTILDGTGVGTIQTDDLPGIRISDVTSPEGNAGGTAFTFRISLSNAHSSDVTVSYSTADNSATTADNDYNGVALTPVTITTGNTFFDVPITVNGDTTNEANETFFVNLSLAVNGTIDDAQGVGTIVNDDVLVSIGDRAALEGNGGTTTFNFTVTLSQASSQNIQVNYQTQDDSASAASGDFVAATSFITILAGNTAGTIPITVNGDLVGEPNEQFFVNITSVTNGSIGDGQGVGTIQTDDPPDLTINDVQLAEGSGGSANMTFTLTLSYAIGTNVTVNYATAPGTANEGGDYTAASGVATVTAGGTTTTVQVPILGDTTSEPDESFFVNLSGISSNATLVDSQGQGLITTDDPVGISINNTSVTEGNSGAVTATFQVTLTNPHATSQVTVNYQTIDGTATTANGDYQGISPQTLTFNVGETTKNVNVTVNGDTASEPDESFSVFLTGPTNAIIVDDTGVGTILNDDGPTVNQAEPPNTQTNVWLNTHVVLTFSDPMNQFLTNPAITVSASPTHTFANLNQFIWNDTSTQVTIVFDVTAPVGIEADDILNEATTYTVTVGTGAESQAGLAMGAPYVTSFTTVTDATPPQVLQIRTVPGNEDPLAGVVTAGVTGFTVTFTDTMITTQGQAEVEGRNYEERDQIDNPDPQVPTNGTTVTWVGQTFTISLDTPLSANSLYRLALGNMNDDAFNWMEWLSIPVVTAGNPLTDMTPPTLIGSAPFDDPGPTTTFSRNTSIFLSFSEVMRPDLASHVTITSGAGSTQFEKEYSSYQGGVEIRPLQAWPAGATIVVQVQGGPAGAKDAAGNPIATTSIQFTVDAGSTNAWELDFDYSGFKNGMTDVSTWNWAGFMMFKETATGARTYINEQTLVPEDISLTEAVPGYSTAIPYKGFEFEDGEDSLRIRNGRGSTSLNQGRTFTLNLRNTLRNTMGVTYAGTTHTFTTVASGGNTRPALFSDPEAGLESNPGGKNLNLRLNGENNNPLPAEQVTVTTTDSAPNTFADTQSNTAGNSFFEYDYDQDPGAAVSSVGLHTFTFSITDGVAAHDWTVKADTRLVTTFPDLTATPDTTTDTTPTYTWSNIAAGTDAVFMQIADSTGNTVLHEWILNANATTFTQPPDYPLTAAGTIYTLRVGAYRSLNNDLRAGDIFAVNEKTFTIN